MNYNTFFQMKKIGYKCDVIVSVSLFDYRWIVLFKSKDMYIVI